MRGREAADRGALVIAVVLAAAQAELAAVLGDDREVVRGHDAPCG